jgi:hypothetical protein
MLRRFIFLLLLTCFSATVFAQVSAPPRDQTQAAVLADMSRRTGETVSLSSLSSQQWYYGTYSFIISLGCGAAPANPPTAGNWQRFVFNYRGLDYIYLVSDNLQSLILCNEPSLPTAIPTTAAPTALAPATATLEGSGQSGGSFGQATATRQGSGQSGGGFAATATSDTSIHAGDTGAGMTPSSILCPLAPRLRLYSGGRVTPGEANWLHSDAGRIMPKIGEIPAGAQFTVLSGPVCDGAAGMNYWQVNYDGLIGWTSEGLNGEYWLEPFNNGFAPETVNQAFIPEWLNGLSDHSIIAISPNGTYLAYTSNRSDLIIIDASNNSQSYVPRAGVSLDVIGFSASGNYLVLGFADGAVKLVEMNPVFRIIADLQHEGEITAISMSHSEAILAVADGSRILTFWSVLALEAPPIRRIELPSIAGNLEFSSDDRLLIVRNRQAELITALQIP